MTLNPWICVGWHDTTCNRIFIWIQFMWSILKARMYLIQFVGKLQPALNYDQSPDQTACPILSRWRMLLNYDYMNACPHNEFYIRTVRKTEIPGRDRGPVFFATCPGQPAAIRVSQVLRQKSCLLCVHEMNAYWRGCLLLHDAYLELLSRYYCNLCGLVVRVRVPALPNFQRSSGSGTGSTQPHEDNWGAISRKWRLRSRKPKLTAVGIVRFADWNHGVCILLQFKTRGKVQDEFNFDSYRTMKPGIYIFNSVRNLIKLLRNVS
jgi:hypothetical protein